MEKGEYVSGIKAAEILGVTRQGLYPHLEAWEKEKRPKVKVIRMGRAWLVRAKDLERVKLGDGYHKFGRNK